MRVEGDSPMQRAAANRARVKELVGEGKTGKTISMRTKDAALVVGIPQETFVSLGRRRQELVISTKGDLVTVKMQGGESQRREGYLWYYGYLQSLVSQSEEEYVGVNPAPEDLLETFEDLKESIAVAEGKRCGSDNEELKIHHFRLFALWTSLGDKANLPHWTNVLNG